MRTNAQAPAFEAACRAAGVPCRVAGATSILDQPAVKAAMAELDRRPAAPLAAVVADLAELAGEVAGDAAPVRGIGGGRRGRRPGIDGRARPLRRGTGWPWPATSSGWIRSASAGGVPGLAGGGGSSRPDRAQPAPADAVTICTFHRAKGLEWPAVWVTGLEQGLVPIGHATTPAAEAEERRLLYVALTRAERELHCSWAEHRRFGGRPVPSGSRRRGWPPSPGDPATAGGGARNGLA